MVSALNLSISMAGFGILLVLVIGSRLLLSWLRRRDNSGSQAEQSTDANSVKRNIHGLEPTVVASFPTILYKSQQVFTFPKENHMCSVCLGDYKEKEILRVLPHCGHSFHITCIDAWLRQHSTCPICRISLRSLLPDTQRDPPLQDVITL